MTDQPILTSVQDGVTTITLNVPERLNAVGVPILNALAEAVRVPDRDRRVIVLRGAGRAFCSGADLAQAGDLADPGGAAATIDAASDAVDAIVASPTPVVAVVHGPAAGVGVPIALAADIVIAAREAYFQLAFTRVGLMPDGGATALVAASVGRQTAVRMALLAERIAADEALRLGLISYAVDAGELEETVARVLTTLRHGPAVAQARTKQAINAATLTGLDAAFQRERTGQIGLLGSADFAEGVRAFLGKQRAAFTDTPF